MSDDSVTEAIRRYQRRIEKCSSDEQKLLHCLIRLSQLPVSVTHLQATGIGRTVNGMRKTVGAVGKTARELVAKWKAMVAEEEEAVESERAAPESDSDLQEDGYESGGSVQDGSSPQVEDSYSPTYVDSSSKQIKSGHDDYRAECKNNGRESHSSYSPTYVDSSSKQNKSGHEDNDDYRVEYENNGRKSPSISSRLTDAEDEYVPVRVLENHTSQNEAYMPASLPNKSSRDKKSSSRYEEYTPQSIKSEVDSKSKIDGLYVPNKLNNSLSSKKKSSSKAEESLPKPIDPKSSSSHKRSRDLEYKNNGRGSSSSPSRLTDAEDEYVPVRVLENHTSQNEAYMPASLPNKSSRDKKSSSKYEEYTPQFIKSEADSKSKIDGVYVPNKLSNNSSSKRKLSGKAEEYVPKPIDSKSSSSHKRSRDPEEEYVPEFTSSASSNSPKKFRNEEEYSPEPARLSESARSHKSSSTKESVQKSEPRSHKTTSRGDGKSSSKEEKRDGHENGSRKQKTEDGSSSKHSKVVHREREKVNDSSGEDGKYGEDADSRSSWEERQVKKTRDESNHRGSKVKESSKSRHRRVSDVSKSDERRASKHGSDKQKNALSEDEILKVVSKSSKHSGDYHHTKEDKHHSNTKHHSEKQSSRNNSKHRSEKVPGSSRDKKHRDDYVEDEQSCISVKENNKYRSDKGSAGEENSYNDDRDPTDKTRTKATEDDGKERRNKTTTKENSLNDSGKDRSARENKKDDRSSSSGKSHKGSSKDRSSEKASAKEYCSGSGSKTDTSLDSPQKTKKSSSSEHKSKDSKKRKKSSDKGEIDCLSGASFAEALGMFDPTASSKKKKEHKRKKENKTLPAVTTSPEELLAPCTREKLPPLEVDLSATLPEISLNYKPLPHLYVPDSPPPCGGQSGMTEEEALNVVMSRSNKNQRTKVYSGVKSGLSYLPSLYEQCIRVLQDNIDALEYTGGVPYDLLKPVLDRANPEQLFNLEHYNHYLIEDTAGLWEFHCQRDFRNQKRGELETWRDMYLRCYDEREEKLKALKARVQNSMQKSVPVRKTILTYQDSVAKPPRNIRQKQVKYGTGLPVGHKLSAGVATKFNPRPKAPGLNSAVSSSSSSRSSAVVKKPAPLMQKTLKFIRGSYRR